jgi:hypothetical protein
MRPPGAGAVDATLAASSWLASGTGSVHKVDSDRG